MEWTMEIVTSEREHGSVSVLVTKGPADLQIKVSWSHIHDVVCMNFWKGQFIYGKNYLSSRVCICVRVYIKNAFDKTFSLLHQISWKKKSLISL